MRQVQDGEYTGLGDNPPGYAGDFEDEPMVLDIYGAWVCDCVDIETAQRIVREHNAHSDLLAACEAISEALVKGELIWKHKRQSDGDPYHPANVALCAALAKAKGAA